MKNIFKQFVGWAIHLSQSEFKKAVILLTVYYTVGVFVVLIIFNLMVYGLFTNSLYLSSVENLEYPSTQTGEVLEEFKIQEIQDSLANTLLFSDALILILTLIVAFVLSKRTLAPLEEAYKKQKRFIADAAHELRTPLAVMQAGSEVILRSERDVVDYTKFIRESLEEVKRLTMLSNNLLFLARNNSKKNSLFSKVSFSEICKKQIEIMRPYGDTKDVSIKNFIDDDLIVLGNGDDLIRLLVNLLKNAIDYNKTGGSVTVVLTKKDNKIILSIEDTGIGIKNEDLPHIFERFYKADDSRVQNMSGTGLGLAIVKEIVDEHHGLIKVKSTFHKGTIFEVILQSA